MNDYLHANNINSNLYSGFKSKYSCTTALRHLVSAWSDGKKNKQCMLILFLDFRKAFDLAHHKILLAKFLKLGIAKNFFSTVRSCLNNLTQCVKIASSLSNTRLIISAVLQGAILKPFPLFTNYLLKLLFNCETHAYVNDTIYSLYH